MRHDVLVWVLVRWLLIVRAFKWRLLLERWLISAEAGLLLIWKQLWIVWRRLEADVNQIALKSLNVFGDLILDSKKYVGKKVFANITKGYYLLPTLRRFSTCLMIVVLFTILELTCECWGDDEYWSEYWLGLYWGWFCPGNDWDVGNWFGGNEGFWFE